jgi:hypothetical protein
MFILIVNFFKFSYKKNNDYFFKQQKTPFEKNKKSNMGDEGNNSPKHMQHNGNND